MASGVRFLRERVVRGASLGWVVDNCGMVVVSGWCGRSYEESGKSICARIRIFGFSNWWGWVCGGGDVSMWRWGNGMG